MGDLGPLADGCLRKGMALLTRRELLFISVLAAGRTRAQEQAPEPPPDAAYEFISGTVTDLSDSRIVVNRAASGKAELRTFLITADTKIEGKLRTKARVTIGFKTSEEGEPIAMRIIVRPQQTQKKP